MRAPGTGTVYRKRGSLWVSFRVNGRRYQESARTTDPAEAHAYLADRLRSLTGPAPACKTFADLAALVLEGIGQCGHAEYDAGPILRRFAEFAGSRSLGELTDAFLDEYARARLSTGIKRSTLWRERETIRRAFRHGWRHGLVRDMPRMEWMALPEPSVPPPPPAIEAQPSSVRALMAWYLEGLQAEGKGLKVTSQVKPLLRLMGDRDATILRGHDFESYRAARRGEKTIRGGPPTQGTVNRELGFLRAAMRLSWKLELTEKPPPFIRMASESGSRRTDWCPVEALERLLAHLRGADPVLADLVEFYFATGWRKEEALSLSWQEVRWDLGQIVPTAGADEVARAPIFPLAGRVREILERRGGRWRRERVFHRGDGSGSPAFGEHGSRPRRRRACRLISRSTVPARVRHAHDPGRRSPGDHEEARRVAVGFCL